MRFIDETSLSLQHEPCSAILFLSREDDDDVRDIGKHDFRSVLLQPMLSNASLLRGTDCWYLQFYHLFILDLSFLLTIAFIFVFNCSFSPLFKFDNFCFRMVQIKLSTTKRVKDLYTAHLFKRQRTPMSPSQASLGLSCLFNGMLAVNKT